MPAGVFQVFHPSAAHSPHLRRYAHFDCLSAWGAGELANEVLGSAMIELKRARRSPRHRVQDRCPVGLAS